MRKKVGIIIAIMLTLAFLLSYIVSYANTGTSIFVNLTKLNENNNNNNIGYGIGNPVSPGTGDYIWNLATYNSKNANDKSVPQRNLYCIKANYGEKWETNPSEIIEYNISFDFQTQRQEILKILDDLDDTTNDTDNAYDVLRKLLDPINGYYREVLWLLDNSYIKGKSDKTEFLEEAGIIYDEEGEAEGYSPYVYQPVTGYDYSDFVTNTEFYYTLTEEDIIAVQKAVIWYFTNAATDNESEFNQREKTQWLTISTNGSTYTNISDITKLVTMEGQDRNDQVNILYNYLIDMAEDNAKNYKEENGYKVTSGEASVNVSGLPKDEDGKYIITTKTVGSDYVVGPIVINKDGNDTYEIKLKVTDQEDTRLGYTFTDSNGTELEDETLQSLVGKTNGFYISVARNQVEKVNIEVVIEQDVATKTLWLNGTKTGNAITKLNAEQPIIEITKEPTKVEFVSTPSEFDLSLRKYITEVNGTAITNTRVPNILESTLQTKTTATYRHKKDPVVVKENDIVTYSITIYNEGNKSGYASQIIDQLPTGLILSTNNSSENTLNQVVSKDKNDNDRNTYTYTYNTTNNTVTFDIVETTANPAQSLSAYQNNGLDCETITLKCKVVEEANEQNQKILTNVAWISAAIDSETGKAAIDRDSQPENAPSVSKGTMENYIGKTTNKTDLTDSNNYYEGQQDDDDFEKLVIMPVVKKFDLALFKHIAAISKDQTIENGEYVTNNGNIDGTYLRAPVVTNIDPTTGKITYQEDNKAALTVEPGDYVLYTIRVYNEGEINGYASKIKDTLPIGLEFVAGNTAYNGIWNLEGLDDDGRQVVTTTWYAKGQGAELNSKPGDDNYTANLLKALNPAGAISDENPDYIDAQVLCKVVEKATSKRVLVNYAQISDDSDENGDPVKDIDSTPDEWIDGDDDQDIERIKLQCFDLSLRKFITSVNGTKYSRTPVVDVTPLTNGTSTTATYKHSKQPVAVQIGDTVIYTIRVYNEGDIDGFASEVTDYLPPYLTFVKDSEINKKYGWQISDDGRIVTTAYLADKKLTAFDGTSALDYEDVQIECLISDNVPVKQNITNIAEISEYTYNGNTVPKDVDSTADNMDSADYLPEDKDLPSYKDNEISKEYVPGNEDDDDFEKVYVKPLDLSLRKFISKVNETSYSRAPVVDVTPLTNGTSTTAIYKHSKKPVSLELGDKVIYTIRVYNEGEANGTAGEVKDYLPLYLKYVKESEINEKYGWEISEDGRIATTTYLSDKEIEGFNGTALDYEDIQIECTIDSNAIPNKNITNIAEISQYKYRETVLPEDIDSESDNMDLPKDEELPDYKKDEENKEYAPGNEDDDDFEKVYVKQFDLALRKFITAVKDEEVTTRIPQVKYEDGKISYEHSKEPVTVHIDDVIIYTLRIYNEGEVAGYASEITDNIPEYLEYLPENVTNVKYMWEMYDENGDKTEDIEKAVKIKTQFLSKEKGEDNLIKAFDGKKVEYKDVKIAFKVKNPNSNTHIITNYAQISDDANENGKPVKDNDSEPDKWNEGEDDQDIENVKVEYFDLALLKFVSKVIVIEDGKEQITETGYNGLEDPEPVVKVELHRKKLSDVVVKFGYGITITNQGDIPGYATEITDYIPEGLRFEATDNPLWTDEGNNVISTKQLEGTLLQPGESATVEVILTWNNGADNLNLKTNTAEISEDKNEYDVPDRDSTPDNKQEGEDDIDIAKVILSIATGAVKTYFTLTLVLLAIIALGVFAIKKFVL